MKTRLLTAVTICGALYITLLAMPQVWGQERKQKIPERELVQLGKQFSLFYMKPTPEVFRGIQRDIATYQQAIQLAGKRNAFDRLCATFLARVQKKHGYAIEGTGPVFELAREINKEDSTNKIAQFINDNERVTPTKLDVWWISFHATGEEDYLSRILAQTGDIKQQGKGVKLGARVLMSAANWSFQSNCRQHAAVREFAARALQQEKWAGKKEFLGECLKRAKSDSSAQGQR